MQKIKISRASLASISLLTIAATLGKNADAADKLDTVIVTANKIEQDAQQTAISMQSLSGEKLSNMGIGNVAEIAQFIPGLQMDQAGGGLTATVRIRGIGAPGYSALDPSVPIFIDGVAQARTGAGFRDLFDIAHIEVLRGPQSILYGRNSTAGAINIWTKDANAYRWSGYLQAQAGNYNDRELKSTVNIPLVESLLAARLSFFSVYQDGYMKNVLHGDNTENGHTSRFGGRAKIALIPAENLSMQWTTSYSKNTEHPGHAWAVVPAFYSDYANSAGGIVSQQGSHQLPHDDRYNGDVYHNVYQSAYDTNFSTSITANWDIDGGVFSKKTLTSITAYNINKSDQLLDQDASILDYGTSAGKADTDSWSQEFRIANSDSDDLEYMIGFYYYAERVTSTQNTNSLHSDAIAAFDALGFNAIGSYPTSADTKNEFGANDEAIFSHVTYSFSPQFSLTAGLRESWAQKRGNSTLNSDIYVGNLNFLHIDKNIVDHENITDSDTSGTLQARYFLNPDDMIYIAYDRGFKPGGFNRLITSASLPTTYNKEISNNYETGAKTQWLKNRLQADIAFFHMDFRDFHHQTLTSNGDVIVENIGKATSDGVELELQALPASNLNLATSVAYVNPRVRSDTSASSNLHKGELIPDSSQYSANVSAEYNRAIPTGHSNGFLRIDWLYRSRYVLGDPRDGYYQNGYSLMDIRCGLRDMGEHWEITSWIKNVFDKEYAVTGNSTSGAQGTALSIYPGSPRTFGITAQYNF